MEWDESGWRWRTVYEPGFSLYIIIEDDRGLSDNTTGLNLTWLAVGGIVMVNDWIRINGIVRNKRIIAPDGIG